MKEKIKKIIYGVIIFFGIIYYCLGIIAIFGGYSLPLIDRWLFVLSTFVMLHLAYKIGQGEFLHKRGDKVNAEEFYKAWHGISEAYEKADEEERKRIKARFLEEYEQAKREK